MKVFHVITSLEVGGAEMMLYKLVRALERTGVHNEVVALGSLGSVAEKIHQTGIPVRTLGMTRNPVSLAKVLRLSRWISAARPDLVQTWMYHADLLGGMAAMLSGKRPVIWNIQASFLEPEGASFSTRAVVRLCTLFSRVLPDAIIANSRVSREQHLKIGYPAKRFEVIPGGFDLELFSPDEGLRAKARHDLGVPADTVLIGQIARFNPMKDHRNFVAAAARIKQARSKTRFAMCGEGMTNQNEELVGWLREAGVVDSFLLLGRRDDVPQLMRAMDILVSSSAYGEGFPNVIGEAMASGTPCVVTDVGDSAYAVGESGIVIPPRDSKVLAEACLRLIETGPEARRELGRRARARVEKCFSLAAITQQYRDFYAEELKRYGGQTV